MATTRRGFLGISTGAAALLAVTQSGKTAAKEIPGWAAAPTKEAGIAIEVLRRGNTHVAPEGIWLRARLTGSAWGLDPLPDTSVLYDYDKTYGPVHYTWRRWKKGGAYTPEPYNRKLRNPGFINNKHLRLGQWVHFVCDEPGEWIYEVTAIYPEGGVWTSQTIAFDGTDQPATYDPDSYYTDATTVYVAADGDYTGVSAGVPSANRVKTWDAAKSRANKLGVPTRILFKGGQTHAMSNTSGTIPSLWCGKWGTGEAVLDCSPQNQFSGNPDDIDLTFSDLSATCFWDDETGVYDYKRACFDFIGTKPGQRVVFYNMDIRNTGGGIGLSGSEEIGCTMTGASFGTKAITCPVSSSGHIDGFANSSYKADGETITITVPGLSGARDQTVTGKSFHYNGRFVGMHEDTPGSWGAALAAANQAASVESLSVIICESRITMTNNSVLYSQLGLHWIGISGCDLKDVPGRIHDRCGGDGGWTGRFNAARIVNVTGCDMLTYRGWANGTSGRVAQPGFRLNNYGVAGYWVNFDRNFAEGSLAHQYAYNNFPEYVVNSVYEKNIVIDVPGSNYGALLISVGGAYIRHNHFMMPNAIATAYYSPDSSQAFQTNGGVILNANYSLLGATLQPGEVKRNTIVYLRDQINSSVSKYHGIYDRENELTGMVVADNIVHAPNLRGATPQTEYGPFVTVDLSAIGSGPLYQGYKTRARSGANSAYLPTHKLGCTSTWNRFPQGSTVTGATSGARATVVTRYKDRMYVRAVSGTFQNGENLLDVAGSVQGAMTGDPVLLGSVNAVVYLRDIVSGSAPAAGQPVTGRQSGGTATVGDYYDGMLYLVLGKTPVWSHEIVDYKGGACFIVNRKIEQGLLQLGDVAGCTITPTHEVDYTGLTGYFLEGETVEFESGATATLCYHQTEQSLMMLRDLTSGVVDGETITGQSTGAKATASGASRTHGACLLYIPDGSFAGGGAAGMLARTKLGWSGAGQKGAFRYG